jgi:hypothetical protein
MYMNIGTVQLYTKSKIKVKVSSFITVLHFTVPVGSSILSKNSYPKMIIKQPLTCSLTVLFLFCRETLFVIWCIELNFPNSGYQQKKKIWVIVQIPSLL